MIQGQGFLELDVSVVSVTCKVASMQECSIENKFELWYLHTTKAQLPTPNFVRHYNRHVR